LRDDQEMALSDRGLRAGQDLGWLHRENVLDRFHEEDEQIGESHLLRPGIKEEDDQTKDDGDHANQYSKVQPQRSRQSLDQWRYRQINFKGMQHQNLPTARKQLHC
jgi:hypothetical protein